MSCCQIAGGHHIAVQGSNRPGMLFVSLRKEYRPYKLFRVSKNVIRFHLLYFTCVLVGGRHAGGASSRTPYEGDPHVRTESHVLAGGHRWSLLQPTSDAGQVGEVCAASHQ